LTATNLLNEKEKPSDFRKEPVNTLRNVREIIKSDELLGKQIVFRRLWIILDTYQLNIVRFKARLD
jgi:hypothetical protein